MLKDFLFKSNYFLFHYLITIDDRFGLLFLIITTTSYIYIYIQLYYKHMWFYNASNPSQNSKTKIFSEKCIHRIVFWLYELMHKSFYTQRIQFLNLIKRNRIWFATIFFRFIWIQKEFRLCQINQKSVIIVQSWFKKKTEFRLIVSNQVSLNTILQLSFINPTILWDIKFQHIWLKSDPGDETIHHSLVPEVSFHSNMDE